MKVAPYFGTPKKKKTDRQGDGEWKKDKNKEHNQKGRGMLKKKCEEKKK